MAISIFIDLPLTILAIVIMYIISPVLALVSLIIMLLYFLVIVLFRNSFNTQIDDCTISKADVTSYMIESINGYETIKGCNIKKQIMEKFEDKYANLSNRMVKLDSSYNFQYLIKELINNLGFIFIVLVGVFLVIEEQITIGQLISFNALLTYFLAPIRNIIDLDTSIKQARVAITKILNLFYNRSSNAILNKTMKGDIVIDNLNYSFGDNTVLKNINLKIINGSKVMVIGSSGSGKSTLFKILKKYYEIPRNQIYIDEIDINDYQTSDIVYVSQSEILFSDTVYNNINSNNIIDISKLCLVDKIVQKNQLGYNMLIEENGFNLSGGERQRIILARAIARDFNILVIDEGLSQVDTNMERKIMKNLFQKYQKQTIIFISHRLDNIDLFDQVIKIEKGQISDDLSKNI